MAKRRKYIFNSVLIVVLAGLAICVYAYYQLRIASPEDKFLFLWRADILTLQLNNDIPRYFDQLSSISVQFESHNSNLRNLTNAEIPFSSHEKGVYSLEILVIADENAVMVLHKVTDVKSKNLIWELDRYYMISN